MSKVEERDCKRRRLDQRGGGGGGIISLSIVDLPDVLLKACLSFVGPGNYRYVVATCKRFQEQYMFRKETTWEKAAMSVSLSKLCHKDHKDAPAKVKENALVFLQDAAVYIGNARVLQWMIDDHSCQPGTDTLAVAGKRGHVNVLEWAANKNLPWRSTLLCNTASRNGHVHMLTWIHQRFPEEMNYSLIARNAARGGHVSILQWLHGILNLLTDMSNNSLRSAWQGAIAENQIHVLDWLVENDFELHEDTAFLAARFGHIEVLAWAEAHGIAWTTSCCSTAAVYGHVDALKWLREHNCPWDGDTIQYAILLGHRDIVQWARENGCPEPLAR